MIYMEMCQDHVRDLGAVNPDSREPRVEATEVPLDVVQLAELVITNLAQARGDEDPPPRVSVHCEQTSCRQTDAV